MNTNLFLKWVKGDKLKVLELHYLNPGHCLVKAKYYYYCTTLLV